MNALPRILVLVMAGVALTSCATRPRALEPVRTRPPAPATEKFLILSHGWHTGLIVRARDLNRRMPALRERFPHREYYEIGWGDAGFYQATDVTTGLALRAMFHSPGAVVHVVAFDGPPARRFSNSRFYEVAASRSNYNNLLEFVASSFAAGPAGKPVSLRHGIYGDSQFYSGTGGYHLFNTCNKWTAKALYSAGVDISPVFKLTASSIMDCDGVRIP